jgi:hypothetical protein
MGQPVVPLLVEELDRASDERMLRSLGFILRAIGDPRAVPALIRAIPRTLVAPAGDYGLTTNDAELLAFMQEHDLDKGREGREFGFGTPFREITGALHLITHQRFNDDELNFVTLMGGPAQHRVQRLLFHKLAERWAAWWENNWQHFTKDPAYAKVNLPPRPDAARPPAAADQPFPTGPNVVASGAWSNVILGPPQPLDDYRTFEDLDSGRMLKWPDELSAPEKAKSEAVAAWAAQEGYDLQGTEYKPANASHSYYALRALGMRSWQIDNRSFGSIVQKLRNGPPKLDRPAGDLFMDFDLQTKAYHPEKEATFLFVTREGATGILQVTGQVTELIGHPYRGVQFRFMLLYEGRNDGGKELISADEY